MDESLELPPGTGDVRAVDRDLFLVPLDLRLADGAMSRRPHLLRWIVRVAALRDRPDHLRDDLARALHLHPVSRAEVLFPDQIEVVQGRELHRRTADLHRLEHRERIQRSRAPDVNLDREQLRLRDVGRELAGDRITRLARDDAELLPERKPVDLHHTAVDREVERPAPFVLEGPRPFVDGLEALAALPMRRDGNTPRREQVEQLRLSFDVETYALGNGDGVAEEPQRSRRRDRRIEHAQ